MRVPSLERGLAGLGALALAGSLAWFALCGDAPDHEAPVTLSAAAYAPAPPLSPPATTPAWAPPTAQRRGREWVYDVFTPPAIFRDARTGRLTVEALKPAEEPPAQPFGLTLRRVERPLYPLQLVGYAGAPGSYRGVFENVITGETFLGAEGRVIDGLGLTIARFDVQPAPLVLPESTTARPLVATATMHNRRTGDEVVLSSALRRFADAPVAWVAVTSSSDELREVREGGAFSAGDARFTIDHIQLDPPVVEVTKQTAGRPQPEHRTLTPSRQP